MARVFDVDTNAWYEPGQLPALPQKAPTQRALSLDPSLGMLPMMPFYQPPEEQGAQRELSPLPQVPKFQLDKPGIRLPGSPAPPPSLDLAPMSGLGGFPASATSADPMQIAENLQKAPPTPTLPPGFSWEGQSGRKFELTPEQGARLRAGYKSMQERMGGSLGPLSGLDEDPAQTASGLMAALSEFMEPEKAAQLALSVHSGELNRLSAEERQRLALEARARRGGSGGAPVAGRPKQTEVSSIYDDVSRDVKLPAMGQSERDLMSILQMTNSPNAFDQRSAIGAKVKEISGAAATDKEREFYLGGAGLWSSLETKLNNVTEGGKLSPDLLQQLRQHALSRLQMIRAERARAAEIGARRLDGISGSPEEIERQKGIMRDYFMGQGGKKPDSGPKKGAAEEADDLLSK